MTRDQFISLFFIALLIVVVHQVFLIFSPFFRAIFWSGILAYAFFPIYVKFREAMKPRETLAALVMTLLIFLVVVPPVVLLLANLIKEAVELYQLATVYVREGNLEKLIDQVRSFGIVQKIEVQVLQWEPLKQSVTDWLLRTTRSIGNFAAFQATNVTKNFFLIALNTIFMTFLLFIFLKDGEKIYQFFYEVAPLEEKNKRSIFRQINDTFAAVIRGQLLTSLTQAVVAGIAFWILGVPAPLFFAAMSFLVALIPVVGASGIWLPLVLFLVISEQYTKAVILFVFGTLVISLIDNLMKPAIIGEKTKLPYFLLFFGILGGLKLYGLMGIFVAPVILSLFFALIKIYQEKFL